jgi:hypothetical protein
MICTKFDQNWPAGSGEDFAFNINTWTHVNIILPIVAPPDPQGPWFEQIWINFISKRFHVSISSYGSVVLEKIFKWPHPIFTFGDYLPFEEDLAFNLNKLEFP